MSASAGHHPTTGYLWPAQKDWAAWDQAWTRLARQITGRPDLTVVIAPGAGGGAPACVYRDLGRIEIDASFIGDPAITDPRRAGHKRAVPAAFGLLLHETGHAVHSAWTTPPHTPAVLAHVAEMLEESRSEAAHRTRRPRDRQYLRATVTTLIHPGDAPIDDPWHAATLAALLLARIDARIIAAKDVRSIRDILTGILGRKRLRELRGIWRAAHQVADHDATTMIDLARQWCQVLGINPDQHPTIPAPNPGAFGGRLAAAIAAWAAPATGLSLPDYLTAAANNSPAHLAAAARHGHATTPASWPRREATDAERRAANQLSRRLAAARTTRPEPGRAATPTPPGRLRTRQAIAVSAQRAAGQTPTATPWTRRAPQPPDKPPLRLAVLVDTSASMRDFAAPMSSAAWILAHAAAANHASTATISFASDISLLTTPGQRPTHVRDMRAAGGTDTFIPALKLADQLLDLRHPDALRLVAVVSDGDLTDIEPAQQLITTLHHTGVVIIWLRPNGLPGHTFTDTTTLHITNPADAITPIADAMTTAFENA